MHPNLLLFLGILIVLVVLTAAYNELTSEEVDETIVTMVKVDQTLFGGEVVTTAERNTYIRPAGRKILVGKRYRLKVGGGAWGRPKMILKVLRELSS